MTDIVERLRAEDAMGGRAEGDQAMSKKRKVMGSYKDALGRLWKYWRGRWRLVKGAKR